MLGAIIGDVVRYVLESAESVEGVNFRVLIRLP